MHGEPYKEFLDQRVARPHAAAAQGDHGDALIGNHEVQRNRAIAGMAREYGPQCVEAVLRHLVRPEMEQKGLGEPLGGSLQFQDFRHEDLRPDFNRFH